MKNKRMKINIPSINNIIENIELLTFTDKQKKDLKKIKKLLEKW